MSVLLSSCLSGGRLTHAARAPMLALALTVMISVAGCRGAATDKPASPIVPTAEQPIATTQPATPTLPAPTLTVTPQRLGTLTQTASECTLDDAGLIVAAGRVEVTVVNETDVMAQFQMWRIGEGHSYEELAEVIDEARQTAEAGGRMITHPSYLSDLTNVVVAAGQSKTVDGGVRPGTYAIVCLRRFPEANMSIRPFALVGPIEVGE